MIGNPKWFNQRKYTGWGITPNCWQGWAYIAVVAAPLIFIKDIPLNEQLKTWFLIIWAILFSIDLVDIMRQVKRDERDVVHEAIAERNAMWFMIAALSLGVAYQVAVGIITNTNQIDPIIWIALIGSMVVKAITHFYLKNK